MLATRHRTLGISCQWRGDPGHPVWQALHPHFAGYTGPLVCRGRQTPGPEEGCVARADSIVGVEGAEVTYILDTAPWINAVTLPHVFPERVRRMLEAPEKKGLCTISLLETAILHRLRRLEFEGTLREFFAVGLASNLQLLDQPTVANSKRYSANEVTAPSIP